MQRRLAALILATTLPLAAARAQDGGGLTAKDLAGKLSAAVQDGNSTVRVKMDVRGGSDSAKNTFQLLIKARRNGSSAEVVYQVLWPKERKAESVLLRRSPDKAPSGTIFTPPDTLKTVSGAQLKEPLFGSDLALADLIENFFSWQNQSFGDTETIDRVPCQILESKPGKGDRSIYGKVRSWIDLKRMVPLRVEKFSEGGQLVRRIDTTRVAEDDTDRKVAASLTVRRAGENSVTELEGSKSRHDVNLTDAEFTPEGLKAAAAK